MEEQNPIGDQLISNAKEESFEAEILDDNHSNEISEAEPDRISRWGFYTTISNPKSAAEAFSELLNRRRSHQEYTAKLIEETYKKDLERYSHQIEDLKSSIAYHSAKLDDYESELELYEEKSKLIKEEIESLEEKILKNLELLGEKKATLIQDRIRQARLELHELIETLDGVKHKKNAINQKTFDINKEALKEESKLFIRIAEHYENTYQKIEKELIGLAGKGINNGVSKFFIFSGVSSTGVAGWLFSIFSSQRGLNSDGWLFFILEALLNFGSNVKGERGIPEALWVIIFIGGLLLIFIMVFLLSWGCQILIKKYLSESKGEQHIALDGSWENTLRFSKKIKSTSFAGMWLQLLPYIFVASIIYVVLQSGSNISDLNSLDEALSGQVAGSTLALMIGGIGFAYITYIMAPRKYNAEKESQGQESLHITDIGLLRMNIEVLILLVLFLVTLIIMYLFNEKGGGALVGFAICSLLSGFLLGTGLRYRSLYQTRDQIENNLLYLQYRIKNNSRPIPLYLTSSENRVFKRRFLELENELLELLVLKTGHIKNLWPKPLWQLNRLGRKLPRWLFNLWFWNPSQSRHMRSKVALTSFEEVQFPSEKLVLDNLQQKLLQKDSELRDYKRNLRELKEGQTAYQKEKNTLIKTLKYRIEVCRKSYTDRMKGHRKQLEYHNEKGVQEETELRKGYDLALWFINQNSLNIK
ncbi:MAG: hypothetical protein Aureis2KO_03960 [Aureisphaera sp.]